MSGRAAHRSETADLTGRVEALERALTIADGRVPDDVAAGVTSALVGVRERLALGVDHTIVALVGGTGSGKSTLFNAISGLDFADVGVRRPTTSTVAACVWGEAGSALLDWLGIDAHRRIQRESELDADSEVALRGLVLLDLPDHDSIEPSHRETVDRLLPMADLLVWVVDPQKYADDALHSGYLRRLAGHESAMVVVLNQVDTVPEDVRGRLQADVERLLREDGLVGVRVLQASARSGGGVPELRALLAGVVAQRSIAAVRAGAEVTDAANLIAREVAAREPARAELPEREVVDTLAQAAGLPAVADAVEAVVRGGGRTVPEAGTVQEGTVELARARWVSSAVEGLPAAWQRALDERVASADRLRRAVADRFVDLPISTAGSSAAGLLRAGAGVALVGAVVAAGLALADVAPLVPVALALVALGVLLGAASHLVRRRDAHGRAERVRTAGTTALEGVVAQLLLAPTLEVWAEHREVRELTTGAAVPDPTSAARGASTSPA
ncbi:GTPase [Cellulomonas fimi]|uniref:ABC transporter n=1 Tax=Cellulomonas fimi TaxID=1708 RepID=A0A7Y0QGW7_CELFI|nr:GTPase [Cellulomonas fimi]NMR19665.1 ABC transporter [Cellulomonas fimi]